MRSEPSKYKPFLTMYFPPFSDFATMTHLNNSFHFRNSLSPFSFIVSRTEFGFF
ncbi:hypothetical protein HanPSC8_Chr08g0337851 [Helianthus annuus]|nr:hypothetical protein HanPSC8_Chr08g0337851 [Helianthus annuus]